MVRNNLNLSVMKTAKALTFYCLVLLLSVSCEKETFEVKDLQLGCLNNVFTVPGWYTDSIFYSGDRLSFVDKKFKNHDEKNTMARFSYNGSMVQILVTGSSGMNQSDTFYYNLIYDGSKISGIETNASRVKADYRYSNDKLSCILYHRNNLLADSITVEYDSRGDNIARARWYKFDVITGKLGLANTASYTYDSKSNPHRNSLHFLYNFYDCEEYSLDYFNRNNIKTVQSTLISIRTEYTYNDYGYPLRVVFSDEIGHETDSNIFCYQCN